ncbi:hypothetical protein B7463_g9928, partial [Scytalidium lignicola]
MATREERMQQRLRGAQRRQVKEVDFGLNFPAAPVPAQSPAQAPAQAIAPNEGEVQEEPLIQTPGSEPQPHDEHERPVDGQLRQAQTPPPVAHTTNDANTSAKRRKLNTDAVLSSGRSTRSSRTAPPPDIYDLDLNEDNSHVTQEAAIGNNGQAQVAEETILDRDTSPLPAAKITSISPIGPLADTPESVHDGAAPDQEELPIISEDLSSILGLQSSTQNNGTAEGAIQDPESPSLQRKRKRDRGNAMHQSAVIPQPNDIEMEDIRELRASSNESSHLRKQPEPDLGSPENSELDVVSGELSVESEDDEDKEDKEDKAEEIGDVEAAIVPQENKRRRISAAASIPLSNPAPPRQPTRTETSRAKTRKKSSPAQQRKAKKTKPKENVGEVQPRAKFKSSGPIPVTVHRLTDGVVYDEEDSDAEILNSEIPYAKRGGVNAIDVLSQISQEIIQSGLNTLAEGGVNADDPVLKQEYRTKWQAVDAFAREIQTRLLEHTINLDNTGVLEKRIRDEQRRKLGLREEILKIRAEREQVALRMDEIRIKHEANTSSAQDADILNSNIYDIELALERGKTKHPHDPANGVVDMTGTELLLKRVAQEASCKSSTGGILKQVKQFNAFLERAALALEAKRK